MSKELEETIKSLKWKCDKGFFNPEEKEELELLFYYIKNSIPKEKVEEKIKELKTRFKSDMPGCYIQMAKLDILQEVLEGK